MIDLWKINEFRSLSWEKAVSPLHGNPSLRDCGCFIIPSPVDGKSLRCMVTSARLEPRIPWDHVSASRMDRVPNWEEMDFLARKFFEPDEVAMQLHVPNTEHVNHHPNCLHLWRPVGAAGTIPVPPSWMVGPDSAKGR